MPNEPFTGASPHPQGKRKQAVVLVTDGENYAGPGDSYKAIKGHGPVRTRLTIGFASWRNSKVGGITLHVIQFANSGSTLQTFLKAIASGLDAPFYHYAPNGAALSLVFQEVTNHLSELRVSR